jgi:hypothetical protein
LFHKHRLGGREDTVEEGRLNVILSDVPIPGGAEVKKCAEGFKASCGCGVPFIVHTIALGVALGNIPDLVANDVASIVTFAFAHQLAFEGPLATGDVRAGDEDEDFEIFEAVEFVTSTSNPILSFRRREGFRPEGVVRGFWCRDDLFHQKEKIRQNQGSEREGQGKGKGEKGHVIHGRGNIQK